jgi:hypothetical protein
MIKPLLTEPEYAVIMSALKECLEKDNKRKRHEELSVVYHTLGGYHGY